MLYFFVMLDLNSCSVVYLERVRQILSLHLKIPPLQKLDSHWQQHMLGTEFLLSCAQLL